MSISSAIILHFEQPYPILTAIGAIVLGLIAVKTFLRIAKFFWCHFLAGPKVKFTKLGEYAVVTGATDGIGKAYAFELAKQGMNLVLISRSQAKLYATAEEITGSYPNRKIKVIPADFQATVGIYERIESELSGLDIGMLINNVGTELNKKLKTQLDDFSRSEALAMLNINMTSAVEMSRIVLPAMVAKKRGVIVNLSSGVTYAPSVFCLYGVTKQFLKEFSAMLRLQYERYGIIVQNVTPFLVHTKMADEALKQLPKGAAFSMVSSDTFVKQTLNTIGRYSNTCGATLHDVAGGFLDCLPDLSCVVDKIVDV